MSNPNAKRVTELLEITDYQGLKDKDLIELVDRNGDPNGNPASRATDFETLYNFLIDYDASMFKNGFFRALAIGNDINLNNLDEDYNLNEWTVDVNLGEDSPLLVKTINIEDGAVTSSKLDSNITVNDADTVDSLEGDELYWITKLLRGDDIDLNNAPYDINLNDWTTDIALTDEDDGLVSSEELDVLDLLELSAKSLDPNDPPNGQSVFWMSDGSETGDDGDILAKVTNSAGTTKTKFISIF